MKTVPCGHRACWVFHILVLPPALFSSPFFGSMFHLHCLALQPLCAPGSGILLPPCLTNILHSSFKFHSKQDELDKATFFPHIFFQIMSRMLPQPPASSSSEENVHHFPSTVVGTCYWFSQIFHCRALNPLCLSPTCERKLLKGRAQGPFNQLYILCI